jgi:hypothetical protein
MTDMKALRTCLLALGAGGLLVLASGCDVQRIVWSPDGTRAAVLGDRGLYLCDTQGNLSGLLASNVAMAGWFSDNRRLALIFKTSYGSWPDLERHLDAPDRERIARHAQTALANLNAGRDFDAAVNTDDLGDNEQHAVAVYLKGAEGIRKWVSDWEAFEKRETDLYELRAGTVSNGEVTLGPAWFRTLTEPAASPMVRVSPGGTAIVLATAAGKHRGARLLVVPADGSSPAQTVSDDACAWPDWTADGRSLVYVRAVGTATNEDELRLGRLTRRQVMDSNGVAQVQTAGEDLAGLLFDISDGVRCLSDGRILFLAVDAHLPATMQDIPEKPEIFVFDPQRQATISRLLPRVADETLRGAGSFDVSPDEKRLLIGGQKGAVSVVTLATGEVAVVQGPGTDDSPSLPSWRGEEVCFLAPAPTNAAGRKWEVTLWKDGGTNQILSAQWPAEIRKGFLDQ